LKSLLILVFLGLFHSSFSKEIHPFHTCITELVFNEKEGNWEVSIRLFQDDLEQGLSQFKGKRFQFQQAQGAEELIQEFVKKQFGFMVNQVMQTPYRFLGWEPQQDVIWVYLEIPTQQSLSGVFLKNSLLVETFPDQTNLVHVVWKGDKKSYLFQKGKEVQQLN
jgi:hypothetical protein